MPSLRDIEVDGTFGNALCRGQAPRQRCNDGDENSRVRIAVLVVPDRATVTNSSDEEQGNAARKGQDPEHRSKTRLVRQVGADKAKAKHDEGDGQAIHDGLGCFLALGDQDTGNEDWQSLETVDLGGVGACLPALKLGQPFPWAVIVESALAARLAKSRGLGKPRTGYRKQASKKDGEVGDCHVAQSRVGGGPSGQGGDVAWPAMRWRGTSPPSEANVVVATQERTRNGGSRELSAGGG
jgi:hypothetical protein